MVIKIASLWHEDVSTFIPKSIPFYGYESTLDFLQLNDHFLGRHFFLLSIVAHYSTLPFLLDITTDYSVCVAHATIYEGAFLFYTIRRMDYCYPYYYSSELLMHAIIAMSSYPKTFALWTVHTKFWTVNHSQCTQLRHSLPFVINIITSLSFTVWMERLLPLYSIFGHFFLTHIHIDLCVCEWGCVPKTLSMKS